MLLDFDESKMHKREFVAKLGKLKKGIQNNYPEALPDQSTAAPVYRLSSLYAPRPLAFSVQTNFFFKGAANVVGKKLTHALYLKESGTRLTTSHSLMSNVYQPQRAGTETLTTCLASLLPDQTIGHRSNIRQYGDQFRYISGLMPKDDFFAYAAQFGKGFILWGIVRGPNVPLPDKEPLKSATWITGACGP